MYGINDPKDAEVGKLYNVVVSDDSSTVRFFVWDSFGNMIPNIRWIPNSSDHHVALVLSKTKTQVTVLLGDMVVKFDFSDNIELSLVPLEEST